VSEEQLRRQVAKLSKQRKDLDKEIEKIQKQLARKLCPKRKKECEPAYCIFRITKSCPFLEKWHEIAQEINS
jgi:hypothetical protein